MLISTSCLLVPTCNPSHREPRDYQYVFHKDHLGTGVLVQYHNHHLPSTYDSLYDVKTRSDEIMGHIEDINIHIFVT